MAISNKRTGTYAAAGIIAAIIIIAAIFSSGIEFPNFGGSLGKTGTLSVSIMDGPADLAHLNVTLDALYLQSDENGTWVQLKFTEGQSSVYFDLLALRNVTKELSTSLMPVGNYSKIRLDVSAANATRSDETTLDLRVPPGHIDVIVSFEIKTDLITNVLLDMQVDTVSISQSGNFKPVLKATVQYFS